MFNFSKSLDQLFHHYEGVPFAIVDWHGTRRTIGIGKPEFAIHFKTRAAIERSIAESSLGFAEAYANGELAIDGDLEEALTALNPIYLALEHVSPWKQWMLNLQSRSLARQKADIEHHYG